MDEDFDTQIRRMQNARHRERYLQSVQKELNGENIYTRYKFWCSVYHEEGDETNATVFSEYLREYNIELTFWQRKYLAEKYFGYSFKWNNSEQDWDIIKENNNGIVD